MSAAVTSRIVGPAVKEAFRPARASQRINSLMPPNTELGRRLASIEMSRPQSHMSVMRIIESSARSLSVDEAIYALRMLATASPGGQKVRRISKEILAHPAYENLHESLVKQATVMKPHEMAVVYNRAVFLRLFSLAEEEVISDMLDQSIARLQPDSLAAVLKALAEVRHIPDARLKAVEERLLAVIRREEEYRDRRLKGKELVRRVRTMAATGDLEVHDLVAAYVSLEKALGRNNAATRELEGIIVSRGLSEVSQTELGRMADVVHPGTPLQHAVMAEFGERPKLSTEVVIRALKLMKRVMPFGELPRRPVANIINTVRFFFATPENQKACRITIMNLMQFVANIDPMAGSPRVVGALLNATVANVDRIPPSHLLRLISHLEDIKLTELHPFYQDKIDKLVDNLVGRGPEALQYPLVQLFALKLLARLGRHEPIYLKGLAEIVVSDALMRGRATEGLKGESNKGEEEVAEEGEDSATVLVQVPKHYENYDNFVLTFAYHLKVDHKDTIHCANLDSLVEEITSSPVRLKALTMAALVCADKLGMGDREIMQATLAATLEETSTKALINIALKPTAATKLAGSEEERDDGAFSKTLLLDHAMGILNERAAETEDPMLAVDLLDLWAEHTDKLPDYEILHRVMMLAMHSTAASVRYMKIIQCIADIGLNKVEATAAGRQEIAAILYAWLLKSNKQFKKLHFGVLAHTLESTAKIHRQLGKLQRYASGECFAEEGLQLDIWAHSAELLASEVSHGALEEADNDTHLYRIVYWWQCLCNDTSITVRTLIRLAHPEMAERLDKLDADVPHSDDVAS
ncbi:hypothetical protein FOL47_007576 [Perkinsus chesapeaki]|uniref:Uncharacterized protein n=1 Tax=Perkinsus chesapeaki TaxID=330153 RepID=A0A7J6LJX4_PERCH|nr:hypothetical protein FOL47_007576 [Perkinsus chesapeaki]